MMKKWIISLVVIIFLGCIGFFVKFKYHNNEIAVNIPHKTPIEENNTDTRDHKKSYNFSDVNIGDTVGGLNLVQKEKDQNTVQLVLEGDIGKKGYLEGFYNEMTEESEFRFIPEDQETLVIPFSTNNDENILFEGKIVNDDILDEQIKTKLLSGDKIPVLVEITKYTYAGIELSEKRVDITLSKYTLQ